LSFQRQHKESVPQAWERFQDYISNCQHHGMENWLLLQNFYHGLSTYTRKTMDAELEVLFCPLTLIQGTNLVEKMASNQAWNEQRQPRKKERGMQQLKEVDMLFAKMDLLMKRHQDKAPEKKEVLQLFESRMTCEECGNNKQSGSQCPQLEENVNYINNNNKYHPQQNQGWTQLRTNNLGNYSGNYQGNNSSNNYSPLRVSVQNQGRIMDNFPKKLASNDKMLETISNKIESFFYHQEPT
jgi:hypothetical protein